MFKNIQIEKDNTNVDKIENIDSEMIDQEEEEPEVIKQVS